MMMWNMELLGWKYAIFLLFFIEFTLAGDFYSLSVKDHEGKIVPLEKYRGQVVLVVNVASECGFTDGHYKALVNTKNLLKNTEKFEILGFPCNQFSGQEPKDITEILEFTQKTYHVNFPIFAKLDVHGDGVAEIYRYLKDQTGHSPTWNFWKYLINPKGEVIGFWGPWSDVQEIFPTIRSAVEAVLTEEKEPRMPSKQALPPTPPNSDDDMPHRQPVNVAKSARILKPSGPPPLPPNLHGSSTGERTRMPPSTEPQPPPPAPKQKPPLKSSPSAPATHHDDL